MEWPSRIPCATYLSVLEYLAGTEGVRSDSRELGAGPGWPVRTESATHKAVKCYAHVLECFIAKGRNMLRVVGGDLEAKLGTAGRDAAPEVWQTVEGLARLVTIIHDLLLVETRTDTETLWISNERSEWPIRFPVRSVDDIKSLRRLFG